VGAGFVDFSDQLQWYPPHSIGAAIASKALVAPISRGAANLIFSGQAGSRT
jgi:hypothetical protein